MVSRWWSSRRHRDHRHFGCSSFARDSSGPGSGPAHTVHEWPQATRTRRAELHVGKEGRASSRVLSRRFRFSRRRRHLFRLPVAVYGGADGVRSLGLHEPRKQLSHRRFSGGNANSELDLSVGQSGGKSLFLPIAGDKRQLQHALARLLFHDELCGQSWVAKLFCSSWEHIAANDGRWDVLRHLSTRHANGWRSISISYELWHWRKPALSISLSDPWRHTQKCNRRYQQYDSLW